MTCIPPLGQNLNCWTPDLKRLQRLFFYIFCNFASIAHRAFYIFWSVTCWYISITILSSIYVYESNYQFSDFWIQMSKEKSQNMAIFFIKLNKQSMVTTTPQPQNKLYSHSKSKRKLPRCSLSQLSLVESNFTLG